MGGTLFALYENNPKRHPNFEILYGTLQKISEEVADLFEAESLTIEYGCGNSTYQPFITHPYLHLLLSERNKSHAPNRRVLIAVNLQLYGIGPEGTGHTSLHPDIP